MQMFQLVPDPKSGHAGINVWRRDMRFTPDGRFLHVPSKALNFLDTQGDRPPASLADFVYGFADGGALAVGRLFKLNAELFATDIRTGQRVTRKLKGCVIAHGAVTADGELFYVAVLPPERYAQGRLSEIRVFAADSLRLRHTFGSFKEQSREVVLSASGNRLASLDYKGFKVWDVTSRRSAAQPPVQIRRKPLLSGFALSNDGTRLVAVDRQGLTIWDTATGKQVVQSGKHRRGVTAVACSPTKPLLATGDNAGNVFLWDYTGRVLTRFGWGLSDISGLCFAPDGLRCAAVDRNGKVVIWDVET